MNPRMETPSLDKFEKRHLVKLHNEGKTYSKIASIAHISVRDIKPTLKKYEKSSSRCGKDKLFQEGKPAVDVAILWI
ncbi:MAG: hypothetical protein WCB31_10270 [Nitrososphaeraceae archaeon]